MIGRITGGIRPFSDDNSDSAMDLYGFLSQVIDNALVEVCVFSAETMHFLYCNRNVIQKTGYPLGELRAMTPSRLFGMSEARLRALLVPLRANAKKEINIETRRRCRDGSSYPIELRLWYCDTVQPPVFIGNAVDISDRRNIEQRNQISRGSTRTKVAREAAELRDTNEKLANLTARLQTVIEEERTSISREIHDELGQILTALGYEVSFLRKKIEYNKDPTVVKILNAIGRLVKDAVHSVQRISIGLRPPMLDELGLSAALEWLVDEFMTHTGIDCRLKVLLGKSSLPVEIETALYRICQEALTNCARHAKTSSVSVHLVCRAEKLSLSIRDRGVGISPRQLNSPKSLGLIGIKERVRHWNGKVQITGKPNKGTTMTITIPLR